MRHLKTIPTETISNIVKPDFELLLTEESLAAINQSFTQFLPVLKGIWEKVGENHQVGDVIVKVIKNGLKQNRPANIDDPKRKAFIIRAVSMLSFYAICMAPSLANVESISQEFRNVQDREVFVVTVLKFHLKEPNNQVAKCLLGFLLKKVMTLESSKSDDM